MVEDRDAVSLDGIDGLSCTGMPGCLLCERPVPTTTGSGDIDRGDILVELTSTGMANGSGDRRALVSHGP